MIEPFYADDRVTVLHGDSLHVLRELDDCSIDAVVTDPPYGMAELPAKVVTAAIAAWLAGDRSHVPDGRGFMGAEWDRFVPPPALWDECLRVLKPGGHLLAFASSRTHDLMGLSIRLAGFEIRDSIAWLYGSGFPKSLDVSKAIDKASGTDRPVIRQVKRTGKVSGTYGAFAGDNIETAPGSEEAREWQGWGTALKPAIEPITVARKPLDGTVAANVLAHGTGAINVDACRIATADDLPGSGGRRVIDNEVYGAGLGVSSGRSAELGGRWPANVVLDESQAAELDQQSGELTSGANPAIRGGDTDKRNVYGGFTGGRNEQPRRGTDSGGASRFFYVAKPDQSERVRVDGVAHTTVKPLSLMRWLVRLVTPPGGTVLDPCAGSGTTAEACLLEGFDCIAVEREAPFLPLIVQRLHRRIDPVQAVKTAGGDAGLFDLLGEEEPA